MYVLGVFNDINIDIENGFLREKFVHNGYSIFRFIGLNYRYYIKHNLPMPYQVLDKKPEC